MVFILAARFGFIPVNILWSSLSPLRVTHVIQSIFPLAKRRHDLKKKNVVVHPSPWITIHSGLFTMLPSIEGYPQWTVYNGWCRTIMDGYPRWTVDGNIFFLRSCLLAREKADCITCVTLNRHHPL